MLEEQRAFTPSRRLARSPQRPCSPGPATTGPSQSEPLTSTAPVPKPMPMQVADATGRSQPAVGEVQQLTVLPGEWLEDAQLRECRTVTNKMTAATNNQRNVSMEIKNGLRILKELIDSIQFSRRASIRVASGSESEVPVRPKAQATEPVECGGRKRAREATTSPASVPSPAGKKPK